LESSNTFRRLDVAPRLVGKSCQNVAPRDHLFVTSSTCWLNPGYQWSKPKTKLYK